MSGVLLDRASIPLIQEVVREVLSRGRGVVSSTGRTLFTERPWFLSSFWPSQSGTSGEILKVAEGGVQFANRPYIEVPETVITMQTDPAFIYICVDRSSGTPTVRALGSPVFSDARTFRGLVHRWGKRGTNYFQCLRLNHCYDFVGDLPMMTKSPGVAVL